MSNKAVKLINEMVVGTIVAETIKTHCTNVILGSMLGFGGGLVASIIAGKVLALVIERTNIVPIVINRLGI